MKSNKTCTCYIFMLAHMVVCHLWFSVQLNMKSHAITHPRITSDEIPSNLKMLPKHFVKMGITPQNMS